MTRTVTTPDTITDDQIADLRAAAAEAGDYLMAAICDVARDGEIGQVYGFRAGARSVLVRGRRLRQPGARRECARILA